MGYVYDIGFGFGLGFGFGFGFGFGLGFGFGFGFGFCVGNAIQGPLAQHNVSTALRLQSAQRNFSIFRIRRMLNSSYYLMYDLVALIFIQFLKHLPATFM
ncbi:hypothetical protein E1J25_16820 [Xanthomonas hortorum pv. taraxaci]|nr:hypothetical protein [Xanthomonas hortorum pv. taraxaci]